MPTPTDDNGDLLTVIAFLDAHLATPHRVEFAGRIGDLLDDSGLRITGAPDRKRQPWGRVRGRW